MLAKHPDYFIVMERVRELIGNADMTTLNSFVPRLRPPSSAFPEKNKGHPKRSLSAKLLPLR